MSSDEREGGCLCGAVRYRVTGVPLLTEYCHCSMCRLQAGAPVVAWMDVAAQDFAFTAGGPTYFASSAWVRRGFCGTCGSALTFDRGPDSPKVTVTIATLDHPEAVPPGQHIFEADRLPWLTLADDLPRHDAWPGDREPT